MARVEVSVEYPLSFQMLRKLLSRNAHLAQTTFQSDITIVNMMDSFPPWAAPVKRYFTRYDLISLESVLVEGLQARGRDSEEELKIGCEYGDGCRKRDGSDVGWKPFEATERNKCTEPPGF